MKINICDYFDVWGNHKEGYEINNWSYPVKDLEIDLPNDKAILSLLKDQCLLNKHVRLNMLDIEDESNGLIMIYSRKHHKPLFCIEYPC